MAVFRVKKEENYTVMSNCHLQEKAMSLEAKGLLSLILSLPNDWDYSMAGLAKLGIESERTIQRVLGELKRFGYVEIIKKKPNETTSGRIEYEYIIYEKSRCQNAYVVEQTRCQKQAVENGVLFAGDNNTKQQEDIYINKEQNTNNKRGKFVPPTAEEITKYCEQMGYKNFDVQYFIDHYESNGWVVGKTKMVSWKSTVNNWVRREKERRQQYGYNKPQQQDIDTSIYNRPDD